METIARDLSKMTYIASNEEFDFYVNQPNKYYWFTYAISKGTNLEVTKVGFTTKKSAVSCAKDWVNWLER